MRIIRRCGPAPAAAHGVRLGEFVAADIAVMIGVEPVEHARPHLAAALLAHRPRLLGGEAAVMVGVDAGEPLVDAVDDLLAGDVGVAVGPLAGPRLGERDAGDGQQGGARQDGELGHGMNPLRKRR